MINKTSKRQDYYHFTETISSPCEHWCPTQIIKKTLRQVQQNFPGNYPGQWLVLNQSSKFSRRPRTRGLAILRDINHVALGPLYSISTDWWLFRTNKKCRITLFPNRLNHTFETVSSLQGNVHTVFSVQMNTENKS